MAALDELQGLEAFGKALDRRRVVVQRQGQRITICRIDQWLELRSHRQRNQGDIDTFATQLNGLRHQPASCDDLGHRPAPGGVDLARLPFVLGHVVQRQVALPT